MNLRPFWRGLMYWCLFVNGADYFYDISHHHNALGNLIFTLAAIVYLLATAKDGPETEPKREA